MKTWWEVVAWGKNTCDPIHHCRTKKQAEKLADKLRSMEEYQGISVNGDECVVYIQHVCDDEIIDD